MRWTMEPTPYMKCPVCQNKKLDFVTPLISKKVWCGKCGHNTDVSEQRIMDSLDLLNMFEQYINDPVDNDDVIEFYDKMWDTVKGMKSYDPNNKPK